MVDIRAQRPLGYPGPARDAALTYAADKNLVHAREMAHGVFATGEPMAKFFNPKPPIQNATFPRGH